VFAYSKNKTTTRVVVLFWVPAAFGRLHPSVILMLGRSEFALRQGFAHGKTLGTPHSRRAARGQHLSRSPIPKF
jgi:hypothetical protein